MVRKALVPLLVSLVVLSIVFPAGLVHRAHAATTGLVCVAAITDSKCPTVQPSFNGPLTTPSTLQRVPIMINNTDTIAGFDITLKVGDVTMLKPYDADLTGTIVPSVVVLVKCIGGVKIQGSSCASTDTSDTIHLAIIDTGIPLPVGTTGLLFTAVFNITGTTPPGGITIGYQTGCPNSSVSGTTICVAMPNGTTSLTRETVQAAAFDNSNIASLPYVTMASAKNNLGQFLQGLTASTTDAMTLASANFYNMTIVPPTVTLSTIVKGKSATPIASLSNPNIDFSTVTSGQVTSTLTATVTTFAAVGNDTVTVTASYLTQDQITFTSSSLEILIVLPISVIDFGITANPSAVSLTQPNIVAQTSISIAPSNFEGQVTLGAMSTSLPNGATASFNPPIITSPTISTLVVTILPSTPSGSYPIVLTASSTLNSVTKVHVAIFTVKLAGADFSISANPMLTILPPPTNRTTLLPVTAITLTSFNFTGSVQLTASVFPAGLGVNLQSPFLTLRLNGQNSTGLIPLETFSTPPGTYHATVVGTSGPISHSVNVTFVVPNPTPGDFAISANPTSVTLPTGSASTTSVITVSSLNGFSGPITLSANSALPLALGLNMSQLNIAAGGSANSVLTITGLNIGPGTFPVTVTGTHVFVVNGTTISTFHTVLILVQVLASPPDFQLFVNLNFGGTTILAGTTTSFNVQVNSVGSLPFEGTIALTGQVFPVLANGPISTLNPTQITLSSAQPFGSSTLTISTTSLTLPGNYTITVQGTSGTLIHTVRFQLTVLPPPILTLSPTKGPIGTQVMVQGSGFVFPSQGFFNPIQVEMTFDDQLVGLFFLQGSTFNFTFNVPESQAGIVHAVHAKVLFFLPTLDVQANFSVLSEPGTLAVNITAGSIYFPGDTATIFAMTTLNGQSTTVTSLQITLLKPSGSNIPLNTILISPGVYKATFSVPTTGSIGTYAILANAHQTGSTDASGLGSFEVEPTWLQSNAHNIATATTIVGAVGALGLVGLAWRKGYFIRRKDEFQGF